MSILNYTDNHIDYSNKLLELSKRDKTYVHSFIFKHIFDSFYAPCDCTDIQDCDIILKLIFDSMMQVQYTPAPKWVQTYILHITQRKIELICCER